MRVWLMATMMALVVAAVVLVACGGDGDDDRVALPVATATPRELTPRTEPRPTATPTPTLGTAWTWCNEVWLEGNGLALRQDALERLGLPLTDRERERLSYLTAYDWDYCRGIGDAAAREASSDMCLNAAEGVTILQGLREQEPRPPESALRFLNRALEEARAFLAACVER